MRISLELSLVGASPQTHLLCVLDQLVAELGMCDGDDLLGTLPGVQTLQVDHAVLGDQVLNGGTGVGADGAVGQGGDDAGLQLAVLALHGGGQADEGLTALGQVSAHDEVQLTAGAGDVLDAGGLGVHLAEQVQVDDVVDGDYKEV